MKFTLRDIFWLVLALSLSFGTWAAIREQHRLSEQNAILATENYYLRSRGRGFSYLKCNMESVITHLSNTHGIKIAVDWKGIERFGIGRTDVVELDTATFSDALPEQLNQLFEGKVQVNASANGLLVLAPDKTVPERR